jgi:hypothetical protein
LSGDGNLTRPVLQQGRYLLEMGWLSRKDQAELGQVARSALISRVRSRTKHWWVRKVSARA